MSRSRFLRLRPYAAQRGVAVIAMLAMFLLAASWFALDKLNLASANRHSVQTVQNSKVLETAKRALLGWAAQNASDTTDINPGRLPCPEDKAYIGNADLEGTAATYCSNTSANMLGSTAGNTVMGRLPWRTLGLPKLVDGSGEPLWYVVSNGWAQSAANTALGINSNTAGNVTVGTQSAVALVIAPGPSIDVSPQNDAKGQQAGFCVARSQSRSASLPDYRDYLECGNADSPMDASFVASVVNNGTNQVFNDQLVMVSSAEIMNAIEGQVAARIQSTVVPQLVATYVTNASQWGATATAPKFPFAVTYSAAAFTAAASAAYKGAAGVTQGLLPFSANTCAGLSTSRCDATWVQWTPATISASVSGTLSTNSQNCAASTGSQISCTFDYSRTCNNPAGGNCSTGSVTATVTAQATNVGLALRTIDASGITGFTSTPTLTAALSNSSGTAATTILGSLASTSCTAACTFSFFGFCFTYGSCTTPASPATIVAPITAFADHPLLNPTTANNWYWYTANRWYEVTYYAIASNHVPGGTSSDCSLVTANCVTVNKYDGTSSSVGVVVALAGRSLNGTVGSSRTLADFLDGGETGASLTFPQNRISKIFNDRFVTVSTN